MVCFPFQLKPVPSVMDGYYPLSDIPAFINTCGDPIMTSDFMDASIYASSPSTLAMYDQEKADMQSSLGLNTTCTSVEAGMSDEFELKAQYEVSQDISNFPLGEVCHTANTSATCSMLQGNSNGMNWESDLKFAKKDVYIKTENANEESLTPTLAELNMNLDLLDDINSYINVEMSQYIAPSKVEETVVKSDPVSSLARGGKESTVDALGQAGGSGQAVLTTLTSVPNPQKVVKTEPVDIPGAGKDISRGVNYQESFTPMMAIKPELIVPRSVPMSMSAPLSTIKEIDISDFTTLQNLLKRSEPSQARVQTSRRRTVSETQLLQKQTPPQRKRSVTTAGFESMDKKWEEIKQFLDIETRTTTDTPPSFPPLTPVKKERTRYGECIMLFLSNGT